MQRFIKHPCRWFTLVYHRALIHDSNTNVRMGLPFSFDENKALDYFNRWRKSFWLAPGDWHKTSVTFTRRYLPFWSFSLKGSASAEAYVKRGSWLLGGAEWHQLTDQVSLSNINLSDINVYAAHTYDRQHILEIDMKINDRLQPIDVLSSNNDIIEEWTIDRDTAFEIGWDLTIVNIIQNLCLKKLRQEKKNEYRITSIRFRTDNEIQELIYFPIYIVDYQYRNKQLQCLMNGRTGQVAGLRQFSRLKVTVLIMGIVYPACLMSFVSIISFGFYAITRRFITIPVALFSTGITLPFVTLSALVIGRYIRDYSHLYRGKRDINEWLDFKKRNPYFFTDKHYDQQSTSQTFNQQRTQETKKSTFSLEIGPDLYAILGVNRVASNIDIKQAYLLKAKEFHPDRNVGNKEIEEKFKLINQAYAILSDPEQRQLFDVYGYDHVKYK
ncbi:unnamed protein product [Rotaria sp. Silwood2]|nr:unnamed protein product [Rotaria sp. Silwood2]CAF2919595.1 unnamed protein product [Rotaria sp. Silwood2]CAF4427373.1 unnamed protein product [Rotaria sp. Silwood2]CAF4472012.1 unnamed protein product [Rotaria sp. Silwood2]